MTDAPKPATAAVNSPYAIVAPGSASRRHTALIYGPSGSGKTRLAGTYEDPVFLDFERGMASVTRPVGRIPADENRRLDTIEGLLEAYKFLKAGDHPFKTVVIDSLNEMIQVEQQYVIDKFKGIQARNYGDVASMADYLKITTDMRRYLRSFLALPYNIVVLCASKDREKDSDLVQPLLPGKMPKEIVRLFDLVGYMVVGQSKEGDRTYNVSFAYHPEYVTKIRTSNGAHVPKLIRADYADIKKALDGEKP